MRGRLVGLVARIVGGVLLAWALAPTIGTMRAAAVIFGVLVVAAAVVADS